MVARASPAFLYRRLKRSSLKNSWSKVSSVSYQHRTLNSELRTQFYIIPKIMPLIVAITTTNETNTTIF